MGVAWGRGYLNPVNPAEGMIIFRDGDANFSDVEDGSSGQVESASTGTGVTSLGTSTVYSLIETSHPVFGKVKRLWNSPMESHREVRERERMINASS